MRNRYRCTALFAGITGAGAMAPAKFHVYGAAASGGPGRQEAVTATATLTSHDVTLRDDVLRQLNWNLYLDASDIGVTVHDGAVTLRGSSRAWRPSSRPSEARRAFGVRAAANELQLRVQLARTDADIAADIAPMFANRATVSPPTVHATVHEGTSG